ncbi:PTS sugar transporter subunit IIA [Paenibacillus septentrionalis]|uniref:Mannitol-specific phosphotransferase enzyme IIA component n=1 Tax=Paenibacillus septentrionalis TaxID=429342 RepID=A0ABW1V4Y5_9BACL
MSILSTDKVKLNVKASDKFEAIRIAGELLVQAGHAEADYVESMIEREQVLSTYMGGGLAIPHGTNEAKGKIKSTGLSIVQIPDGVAFGDGDTAYVVIGIAAVGDDHMDILTSVAMVCSDEENLDRIVKAETPQQLIDIFESEME